MKQQTVTAIPAGKQADQGRTELTATLSAAAFALMLTACGGSDGRNEDTFGTPRPVVRCEGCADGRISGSAALAAPLADALVTVFDADGRRAGGRTDGAGRYDIDVGALRAPLLIQVVADVAGEGVRLHSAARRDEIGFKAIGVNALTELITASALGGPPGDLLDAGRAEIARLESAVPLSTNEVVGRVRSVLDEAGVGRDADPRTTPAGPHDGASLPPLRLALAMLDVAPAVQGYAVRYLAQAPNQALAFSPGGADAGVALPPLLPAEGADLRAGLAALPAVAGELHRLAARFAAGIAPAEELREFFADDFRHAGLDATGFIEGVLRRQDPAAQGGFDLAGVRFESLRLREVATGAQRLRVSMRVVPRAPHRAYDETMWLVLADGRWRLQGDGSHARVRIRAAAVLGPRPLDGAQIRALPGVRCVPTSADGKNERCSIEGGLGVVPAGGFLDLGETVSQDSPHSASVFGVRALYRSQAADPLQRLSHYRNLSQRLGHASAHVMNYLLFEVDAVQADPHAIRARITGPGLPAAGLLLHRPAPESGALPFHRWTVDPDGRIDWHGALAPSTVCTAPDQNGQCDAAARRPLTTGTVYTIELRDATDRPIASLPVQLAAVPLDPQRLLAERETWFATWQLAADPAQQPTLPNVIEDSGPDAGKLFAQAWLAPRGAGQQLRSIRLEWHRAALPPGNQRRTLRRVWPVDGNGRLDTMLSTSDGMRSTWLGLVTESRDPLGRAFLHYVSPDNPY